MHQIVCRLGLRPRPLIALPRLPSWFRGGTPRGRGKGKREGREIEGRGRWDWDPPPGTGREGKAVEGSMGWEVREWVGKEGRGGRGNKLTRF